jgi:hypothetical protein
MLTSVSEAKVLPLHPAADPVAWEPVLEQDVSSGAIEPWIVLPGQFADSSRTTEHSGEKRLMAAVLADAVQCYLKNHQGRGAAAQILFRETEHWFESPDRRWLLSFENVCDVLNIDADRLRRALRAQIASGVSRRLPVDAGRLRVARGRKMRI